MLHNEDDLDNDAPDVHRSYDETEEDQSVLQVSHDMGQPWFPPLGHQGVGECHCSLHCNLEVPMMPFFPWSIIAKL